MESFFSERLKRKTRPGKISCSLSEISRLQFILYTNISNEQTTRVGDLLRMVKCKN